MNKAYQKVGWKNEPSVETPINDENLGIMDNGIDVLDDRIVELDKTKASQADYLQLQTEVSNQSEALSSAQEQISSLNGKTDQTNEAVNVLGQKTDLLTFDVENLKTKTDETNSDVEELKGKTDSAAEDIATLKEKADETSEKLTEHEKLLNQHEEAIDNRIKKFYTSNLSETHIADSDDGAFRNIVVGGKSEQKTTTGAQLIAPVKKQTIERNGVTITYDNGIVTMNGTAIETLGYGLVDLASGFLQPLEANTTYCLSTEPRNTYEQGKTYAHYWNNSFSAVKGLTKTNGYGVFDTNTTGTGETSGNIAVYVEEGVTYNNYSFSIQFEKGSTPSPHEPYTGGQPSPNPDYPQEIKSADGMYTGKNKLPNIATTTTISGVTFTVNEDKSITVSGKSTQRVNFKISEDNFVLPIGSYIMSGSDINPTTSYCTMSDNIVDGSGAIKIVTSAGVEAHIEVQNSNTQHTISISVEANRTVPNVTFYPMIRPAKTDSEYEPYTGGVPAPAPNKLVMKVNGKNLLPNNMVNATVNGITLTKNEDGSITLNGTSTDRVLKDVFVGTLSAGEYIFSQGSYSDLFGLYLMYTENNEQVFVDLVRSAYGERAFALTEDKEVTVRADVRNAGTYVSNMKLYPMIRLANVTDSKYRPYKPEQLAPIPFTLRSVGEGENEVRDLLYPYADGTGKLVHSIVVLLPSDFRDTGFTGEGYRISSIRSDIIPGSAVLCTHLTQNNSLSQYSAVGDYTSTAESTATLKVRFKQSFADINECIDYMESKNMRFYVAVQTPIETILTAEQVKALFELRTHYGGTNISFKTENGVEPTINFDYACSLENFVEYIKEQMGDDRKFVYDMEDRLAQGNKALEQYLDAMLGME